LPFRILVTKNISELVHFMRNSSRLFIKVFTSACFLLVTANVVLAQSGVRKIAFSYGGGAFSSSIAIINDDGTGQRRLTDQGSNDNEPSWSPDGSQIVFYSNRLAGRLNIFRINADGSGMAPLTDSTLPVNSWSPCWSPDGSKIAFVSDRDGPRKAEIWVMNADGSNLQKLTTNVQLGADSSGPFYSMDQNPAWAPDGTKIAFWSTRDGGANPEIYSMAVNGTNLTRLTNNSAEDKEPAWSPDSQHIAYFSRGGGRNGIYVMDANGANDHRVSDGFLPSWSPDGTRLAITDFDPTNNFLFTLYKVNVDGTNKVRITSNSIDSLNPDWAPLSAPPAPTYTIAGKVTEGSSGLNQTTLALSGDLTRTTQSDINGDYSFAGLGPGTYRAVATKTGYSFNPPAYDFVNMAENRVANFAAFTSFSISGQIAGLNGNIVTVTLSGSQNRTTQTEPDGSYSFTSLPAGGNFTVTPMRSCLDFTPASRTFDNLSANQTSNFAAAPRPIHISGRVTRFGTGNGMAGVTISIYLPIGPPRTTLTDANGNYSFDGGSSGQFLVASKANYNFDPSSRDINSCEMTQVNFVGHSANNLLFSAGNYTVAEDNCSIQIAVLRGGNASGVGPITVAYATSSGTASAGSDYGAVSGTLSFPEGTFIQTITIPLPEDSLVEGNETFFVVLSDPTGEVDLVSPSTALVTIADNDPVAPPQLQMETNSDYAIALDSVTLLRDPFTLLNPVDFGTDRRTRILLFLVNGRLRSCEDLSVISVQGEDSVHQLHDLTVEDVRAVPGFSLFSQVVIKLPATVPSGDMFLTVRLRGSASNRARIRIQ
jgi:Tol biopolymer transport system component